MRIVFLLERPSQFDAPLFRLAHTDRENRFEAWFLDPDPGGAVVDPEIGGEVSWGMDPTSGYPFRIVPTVGQGGWFGTNLEKVDFLVVNGYTRRPYRVAAHCARALGVPRALRIDSVWFPGDRGPSLARRALMRGFLGRLFGRFLTTGSLGQRHLRGCGVADERISRFPYAVDHASFASASAGDRVANRARWGVLDDSCVILALAKFSEREAPWDLIEARRSAGAERNRVYILAGEGPLREQIANRVAGFDDVLLPGYVPYPELPSLYSAADLFVHAAREERWGVSVAEALACGLPVVTSDRVGASYDLVIPGGNGGRYPLGSSGALNAEIRSALTLDRAKVAEVSRPLLVEFGIESTWRGIVEFARRSRP